MLLKTKLTNQLKKEAFEQGIRIEIYLNNISVNGTKTGCSGHVVNSMTCGCVYLNTEGSVLSSLAGKSMFRLARDTKDWSSNSLKNGYNRWVKDENLASSVISVLKREKGERK